MIKNEKLKKIGSNIKAVLIIVGACLVLANMAFAEFWLGEMIGLQANQLQLPDPILYISILIFFIALIAFFFNRLYALVFEEIRL